MKFWIISLKLLQKRSPPSRGAWIEISRRVTIVTSATVAPLAGGVD